MLILDLSADITASDGFVLRLHPLLFQKTQQTGSQGPETQDRSSGQHLVVVTAEQVFLILEKRLHVPADSQDIHQGLSLEIQDRTAPVADRLEGLLRIMTGDQQQGGS